MKKILKRRVLLKIYYLIGSLFTSKNTIREDFRKRYCMTCSSDLVLKDCQYMHPSASMYIGENSRLLCWGTYNSGLVPQELSPNLIIGKNFRATRNLTIQCAGRIEIGNDVLIASNVFIIDYNHGTNPLTKNYLDNQLDPSEVVIGDGVWIGNDVIILPGVHIGKKAIIGAGSVVCKDIPEFSIAVGNPAKVIKKYDFVNKRWCKINY